MFSVTLNTMKNAFLLVMLLCVGTVGWAQKTYFIYIQSDTQTPFYVKMGSKVLSASSTGYLILPELLENTHNFQLGPAAGEGELQFSVPVRQSDRGFLLKKFSDGWGLFDLQNMQVIKPTNSAEGFAYTQRVRDDRFTHLLAEAADDTTVFYQPIIASATPAKKTDRPKAPETTTTKAEESSSVSPVTANTVQQQVDTVVSVATGNANGVSQKNDGATVAVQPPTVAKDSANNDSVLAKATEVTVPATTNTVVAASNNATTSVDSIAEVKEEEGEALVYKKSKITRRAESSTVDGFGLVYWDEVDGVVDTIQIFIPNQKFVFAEAKVEPEGEIINGKDVVAENGVATNDKKATPPKTCNGKASDKDFFRIRKSLVSFDTETQMVIAARSSFRNKCFSVEQIKNLSTLFLTQDGKWQFLEAAFPHVTDKSAFSGLQSELRDEPYISRFKALMEQ